MDPYAVNACWPGSGLTCVGAAGAVREAAAGGQLRRTSVAGACARGRIYLKCRSTTPVVGPHEGSSGDEHHALRRGHGERGRNLSRLTTMARLPQ